MGLFPHLCFEVEFLILFKDLRRRHSPYLANKVQLMNKENRKKLSTRIKLVKKSLRRKKKRERTKIVIAY